MENYTDNYYHYNYVKQFTLSKEVEIVLMIIIILFLEVLKPLALQDNML